MPEGLRDNCATYFTQSGSSAVETAIKFVRKITGRTQILAFHGCDVVTAGTGEEAIEIVREFRPEVVILDLGLPRIGGLEVGRQIRKEQWGRSMILIACTGWGQPEDVQRSREAGFDHHLVKPVNLDVVLRLLSTHPPPAW